MTYKIGNKEILESRLNSLAIDEVSAAINEWTKKTKWDEHKFNLLDKIKRPGGELTFNYVHLPNDVQFYLFDDIRNYYKGNIANQFISINFDFIYGVPVTDLSEKFIDLVTRDTLLCSYDTLEKYVSDTIKYGLSKENKVRNYMDFFELDYQLQVVTRRSGHSLKVIKLQRPHILGLKEEELEKPHVLRKFKKVVASRLVGL